jgi:hypothetical protein
VLLLPCRWCGGSVADLSAGFGGGVGSRCRTFDGCARVVVYSRGLLLAIIRFVLWAHQQCKQSQSCVLFSPDTSLSPHTLLSINVGAGCAPAALAQKRFNLPRRTDRGVSGGAEHGTRGYVGDTLGTMRPPCESCPLLPSPTLSYPLLPVFCIISCMCACPYHESVLWTILSNTIPQL